MSSNGGYKMPKYECIFSMNEHEIVNAKNKNEAKEKVNEILKSKFYNELDFSDVKKV